MTDLKDTVQVGLANFSAIGVSVAHFNEYLTLVSADVVNEPLEEEDDDICLL